jgi:hypothetical protein
MGSLSPGGQPNLKLKSKHAPTYPAGAIKSARDADYASIGPSNPVPMKLGIRVKKGQTPTLILTTRATPGNPGTPVPLTPLPDTDPVIDDLKKGLGCDTEEQWFAYDFTWKPSLGVKFDSDLTLTPFPYPPLVTDNGFQVVTTAFRHASGSFQSGSYSYAISVLPGKNSGSPIGGIGPLSKKTTAKKTTAKKKTKKKTSKPSARKAKSKKKSRR